MLLHGLSVFLASFVDLLEHLLDVDEGILLVNLDQPLNVFLLVEVVFSFVLPMKQVQHQRVVTQVINLALEVSLP